MRESNNREVTDKPKSADHFTHSAPVAKSEGTVLSIATKKGLTREPTECDKGSTSAVRVILKPDRTRDV